MSKTWDDACGENKPLVITEDTGVITSPNYPYTYFNNLNCQWLIPPESGRFVNMSLLDYEMQQYYDGVYIRDGLNNSAPNLGPVTGYMGNNPAMTLLGSGEGVFVNFLSNANTRKRIPSCKLIQNWWSRARARENREDTTHQNTTRFSLLCSNVVS